jgi:hypothetical protein
VIEISKEWAGCKENTGEYNLAPDLEKLAV